MDIWELVKDVETRDFRIKNGKGFVEARKNFFRSIFSNNALLVNKMDSDDRQFLFDLLENELSKERYEAVSKLLKVLFVSSSENEDINDIKQLWNQYEMEFKTFSVIDDLQEKLAEQEKTTFYYIGINEFVLDYYRNNPNSEWKIKAILQMGYPFDFANSKSTDEETAYLDNLVKSHLENKKWSLFVFTKESFDKVILGFDDKNYFAKLDYINSKKHYDVCDVGLSEKYRGTPVFVEKLPHYDILCKFLDNNTIQQYTDAQKSSYKYSFNEIPSEYFRIDYLNYLSRYKQSVLEVFGPPKKDEKISSLKEVVNFVNVPNRRKEIPSFEEREHNVLLEDFFFQSRELKPKVVIGEQDYDNPTVDEQYEINSKRDNISPYYLYCLLSSELVRDYYSDRYSAEIYNSEKPLPLEDCIYIEMSSDKMCDKNYKEIYERNIRLTLKAADMINTNNLSTIDAKEAIDNYLIEIHNDIRNGAYYSATIVIGSVLEAFLIDWLTEIDGKNYFKQDFEVTGIKKKKNKKGKKYYARYSRRANFWDYINEIKKRKPDWIDGAEKATEIRKKRNTVHAKLYIEKEEISEEKCYELLNNLEIIINNRWPK